MKKGLIPLGGTMMAGAATFAIASLWGYVFSQPWAIAVWAGDRGGATLGALFVTAIIGLILYNADTW